MIVDVLGAPGRPGLSWTPSLRAAISWIESHRANPPASGHYPLDDSRVGEGMFAIVDRYDTKPASEVSFEAHRAFLDVQYIVSGTEIIYHRPHLDAGIDRVSYSAEKDIEFIRAPSVFDSSSRVVLEPGMLAIFWPGEWHAPCISVGGAQCRVTKIVVKVPADLLSGGDVTG